MTTPADNNEVLSPNAQVTITGRNVEVPEHFAERVNGKLAKIERLDPTLTFFHVELQHEPNPRRADRSDRIQITATGKGHLARAEAKEDSFYAALESALERLNRTNHLARIVSAVGVLGTIAAVLFADPAMAVPLVAITALTVGAAFVYRSRANRA